MCRRVARWQAHTYPGVVAGLGLAALLVGGCASPQGDTLKLLSNVNAARLRASYGSPETLSQAIQEAQYSPARRNALINDLILIVDLNYYEWERRLYQKKAGFDLGTDATLLGLGGATALAATTGLANVLGQISTGITGLKSSVDADVLQKNTIPALVAKMRAARATELAKIQAAMTATDTNKNPIGPSDVAKYSVQQALIDVNHYHAAGTFVSALQDITARASQEEAAADRKINTLKPNANLINQTPDLPDGSR